MSEAVMAGTGFASDNSGVTQKVFSTAFFGFRRDEVLEYVERIERENTQSISQLNAQIESLEKDYSASVDDKNILLEKIREAGETLHREKQRAVEAQDALAELHIKMDATTEEMAGYKSRLFSREQETVVLKADNSRLNATIDSLTLTVSRYEARRDELAQQEEKAREQADNIIKEAQLAASAEKDSILSEANDKSERAQREARELLDKASDDAVALIAATEREKNAAKQMINSSAGNIAESIVVLKAELSVVDAKIASATENLQRATTTITLALEGTERNLETLGVQIHKFPEFAPTARLVKEQAPQRSYTAPHTQRRHVSVAETILDGLTRILGER